MVNHWLGMGMVLAIFGVLIGGLRAYRRSRSADPELVRKLLHLGMGLLTISFPWLFASAWPVLLLAALFALGLTALRISPPLRRLLGGVIDGVNRKSLGEITFPFAVGLLYLFSAGDPLTFCIPMLILSLADAAAALVGGRYGTLRVPGPRGEKSLEGSLAFLAVAFVSTHVPLLLFTDCGRAESLLIAVTLALQATLLEASAWGGLDNLLVPLGAFALLKSFLELDMTSLILRLSLAVLLVALFLIVHPPLRVLNPEEPDTRGAIPGRIIRGIREGLRHGLL